MTRVLLDTHTLIWALSSPDRLGARALELLRDRTTTLFVSAVSAWEMSTKVRLGKLPAAARIVDEYGSHLEQLGAQDLAIERRHALLAGSMRWDHRDPFDRMLAAQAIVEDLPLLSADTAFASLPGIDIRW